MRATHVMALTQYDTVRPPTGAKYPLTPTSCYATDERDNSTRGSLPTGLTPPLSSPRLVPDGDTQAPCYSHLPMVVGADNLDDCHHVTQSSAAKRCPVTAPFSPRARGPLMMTSHTYATACHSWQWTG